MALAKPNKTLVTVGFRNLNLTYKSNFCQSVTLAGLGQVAVEGVRLMARSESMAWEISRKNTG